MLVRIKKKKGNEVTIYSLRFLFPHGEKYQDNEWCVVSRDSAICNWGQYARPTSAMGRRKPSHILEDNVKIILGLMRGNSSLFSLSVLVQFY